MSKIVNSVKYDKFCGMLINDFYIVRIRVRIYEFMFKFVFGYGLLIKVFEILFNYVYYLLFGLYY